MANTQTSVPVFTAGQVLTAAQQNQINTGIPVFADSTARDAAFGGTGEKTLAEGQFAFLEDTDTTQYYDGAAWQAVDASNGLTFITGATFTTATSFSLPTNTFSSVYQNYKFVVNITAVTADADFTLRLRASGTDSLVGYYTMLTGLNSSAGASNVGQDNQSSFNVGESDNTVIGYSLVLDVIAPQLAVNTTLHGSVVLVNKPQTTVIARSGGFFHFVNSAFDSLTFISSVASSITGNYKVYGYANS
jgi:hypothetical protein